MQNVLAIRALRRRQHTWRGLALHRLTMMPIGVRSKPHLAAEGMFPNLPAVGETLVKDQCHSSWQNMASSKEGMFPSLLDVNYMVLPVVPSISPLHSWLKKYPHPTMGAPTLLLHQTYWKTLGMDRRLAKSTCRLELRPKTSKTWVGTHTGQPTLREQHKRCVVLQIYLHFHRGRHLSRSYHLRMDPLVLWVWSTI